MAGGNDYAFGGATTGYSGTNNSAVPNLAEQIAAFSFSHSGFAPSSALYTFSIGANDLFGILNAGLGHTTAAQALAAGAAEAVAAGASTLESEGAKNLVLFDVPDLGVTPRHCGGPGSTVSAEASALSAFFDQQVLADLAPVEAAGLNVFDLDTYALIDQAVSDPSKFGFSDVKDPCWTGAYTGYATGGTLCSTLPAVQDTYLFWDEVHPTAAGHLLVAEDGRYLLTGAVPEPSTWAMMILGFAGLGVLGARKVRSAAPAG